MVYFSSLNDIIVSCYHISFIYSLIYILSFLSYLFFCLSISCVYGNFDKTVRSHLDYESTFVNMEIGWGATRCLDFQEVWVEFLITVWVNQYKVSTIYRPITFEPALVVTCELKSVSYRFDTVYSIVIHSSINVLPYEPWIQLISTLSKYYPLSVYYSYYFSRRVVSLKLAYLKCALRWHTVTISIDICISFNIQFKKHQKWMEKSISTVMM